MDSGSRCHSAVLTQPICVSEETARIAAHEETELRTVLYFPFRQTALTDNDNGFFRFSAGSLNLQPEKAAEPLLRFARKCPME
jgi:hypothetical protein